MKIWEIWEEGFSCTGDSGTAQCRASKEDGITTETFDEAVQIMIDELFRQPYPGTSRENFKRHEDGTWTHWGCRLFDNEADARKSFG